jgi:hypothetical protein
MMSMSDDSALPFTRFRLTLRRTGGIAGIDHTTELSWEGGAGTVCFCRRGVRKTVPADAARARAFWDRLEAAGFWKPRPRRPAPLGRLGWLLFDPRVTDAMHTEVTADAVASAAPGSPSPQGRQTSALSNCST